MVHTRSLILAMAIMALTLPACTSLTIDNVNFGWPVESHLTVTPSNTVEEVRYAIAFSVVPLALAEFGDSTALSGASLRILRNPEGFYFVAGPGFKHVYIFASSAGSLVQHAALEVSATGLSDPAFNLRPPYVELVDGGATSRFLTSSAIVEGKK